MIGVPSLSSGSLFRSSKFSSISETTHRKKPSFHLLSQKRKLKVKPFRFCRNKKPKIKRFFPLFSLWRERVWRGFRKGARLLHSLGNSSTFLGSIRGKLTRPDFLLSGPKVLSWTDIKRYAGPHITQTTLYLI